MSALTPGHPDHGTGLPARTVKKEPRRFSLRTRLIVSYVLFVAPVLALSGLFYYETARRGLDAELGKRLVAIAQVTATRLTPLIVASFEPGDESGRTHHGYRASLLRIRDRTDLRRLYVFDREGRSLLDTREAIPVGAPYARLQFLRSELEACLAGGTAASVLFQGEDGLWYKSGFAPLEDEEGTVVAVVGADASAAYLELISGLRRSVLLFVLLGAGATALLGYLLGRSIAAPVSRLASRAEAIGQGRLDEPVESGPGDPRELASLAETLDRMRERLGQREDNQRLMVAGVAHEIRNPLGGIELFASLARRELAPGSEPARYLERVIEETGSLKRIVGLFLEFARPLAVSAVDLELERVAGPAAEMLAGRAREKGARIELRLSPEAAAAHADPGQLQHVFMNLFANALEALPDQGGLVEVCSARESVGGAEFVRVEVRDNGCGMSEEVLKKAFNPFFTTRDGGIGLGLAIVRKVLEENGGWIEARSTVGRGTSFLLHLPGPGGGDRGGRLRAAGASTEEPEREEPKSDVPVQG